MTQEEQKYLGKTRLWLILHNKKIRALHCVPLCEYGRQVCPDKILCLREDLEKCEEMDKTLYMRRAIWWCIEFMRSPKRD